MVIRKVFFLSALSLLIAISSKAQNTINYLNGKIIKAKQYEINGEKVLFIESGSEKEKTKKVNKLKLFSIVENDGKETILYSKNASVPDEMSVDEMRYFMLGEQFAIQHYSNNWNKIGGLAGGLTGGLIGYYGLPIPLFYALINERISPIIKYPNGVALPEDSSHEYFQYGYQKRAANKKLSEIFIFGGIGLTIGITTFILVFEN